MPIDVHRKHKSPEPAQMSKRRGPPTSTEVIEDQKEQARKLKEAKAAAVNNVPATVTAATPATLAADNRSPEERYIDEIAPSMIASQLVKFSREGQFLVAETKEEISPD